MVTAPSCYSLLNGIAVVKLLKKWGRGEPTHLSALGRGWACESSLCVDWAGPVADRAQSGYCLFGKAMASYCNYLWKKIFDVFGRGWMWGDEGGRIAGLSLLSHPLQISQWPGQGLCSPQERILCDTMLGVCSREA